MAKHEQQDRPLDWDATWSTGKPKWAWCEKSQVWWSVGSTKRWPGDCGCIQCKKEREAAKRRERWWTDLEYRKQRNTYLKAWCKEQRQTNPEYRNKVNTRGKTWQKENCRKDPARQWLAVAVQAAKKANRPYPIPGSLTHHSLLHHIRNLAKSTTFCRYYGIRLYFGHYKNAAVDHLIPREERPDLEFEPTNLSWVSKEANMKKNCVSYGAFIIDLATWPPERWVMIRAKALNITIKEYVTSGGDAVHVHPNWVPPWLGPESMQLAKEQAQLLLTRLSQLTTNTKESAA